MKFRGRKVKPYNYLSILEEAFRKACDLYLAKESQGFADMIERNKNHGNTSLDEIESAIYFVSNHESGK